MLPDLLELAKGSMDSERRRDEFALPEAPECLALPE
jgi:hypothetical protein